ncbi:(2Fe-2S)-binding protein [Brachyspira hampsonii]|uniref:[2Fe-2S] binding domain-containing protein n=2 Tax=Brachyspira hampsonii TaxID=1287055 RepID=A0A2U4EXP7_9SPIR|nr:(2Fe-2S)-binding protein [Brachyspira hampsonii]EKV58048.1 [2Fe-2S] binding domain-containing protein [Brachyspira hampsonii 30446]MBW5389564.1 (2Fe-2S)-binding protein [Brachyspira hampsonii]MBW5395823.1 (2Fe-2S)-binding protein [Brachyspira hampsonii]OEJ15789.1 (2Fe-2S)-binding protein [Brachyspira hampsonii]OEJ16742.1 (2Fe-2S)-binding protein [Brachyspira hampsonii]
MGYDVEYLKNQTSINYDKTLCYCKNVSYRDAYKVIADNRLTKLEEVVEKTQASTGCGGCKDRITSLIEYAKNNNYEPLNV